MAEICCLHAIGIGIDKRMTGYHRWKPTYHSADGRTNLPVAAERTNVARGSSNTTLMGLYIADSEERRAIYPEPR